MARYAHLTSGTVGNVIEADADFVAHFSESTLVLLDDDSPVGLAWTYDGTTWTPPEHTGPQAVPSVEPLRVPETTD